MSTLLVTGLYDIKRDEWKNYSRTFDTYLDNFRNVLNTNCDIVVFYEDDRVLNIIKEKNKSNIKHVYMPLKKYNSYRLYYNKVNSIISSSDFRCRLMRGDKPPEHNSAIYNILMLCKSDMLLYAINNFNYDYYFWIDAGYSENGELFINNAFPSYDTLKMLNDKVTFFLDENVSDVNNLTNFRNNEYCKQFTFSSDKIYISGCFFGGHRKAMGGFISEFNMIADMYHTMNMTDDDQTFLNMVYSRNIDSYNLIKLERVKKCKQSFFAGYFMLCK